MVPWVAIGLGVAGARPLMRAGGPAVDQMPRYTLDLAISDAEGRYQGTGTVTFRNPSPAPLAALPFVLHPNDGPNPTLNLTRIEVTAGPAGTWAVGHPSERLLTFDQPLAPGAAVTVGFSFEGTLRALPADSNDLFAQGASQLAALGGTGGGGDFGLLAVGDGILVAASAFPMVVPFVDGAPAHRVLRPDLPVGDLAWNVPASFSVRIVTPTGLGVVTNLVDRPGPAVDGGQVVLAEGAGVTDVVVVAARDWVVAEERVGEVTVRSWARASDAAAGKAVLATATRSVRFLERYGAYPFTELDLVEATLVGGAGGVEFGGLALIAGFLYRDPAGSPLAAMMPLLGGGAAPLAQIADQRAFVVAHEVAHQWCPGLVGADAWSDPVLDEPLAQYLAWRVVTDGLGASAANGIADRQIALSYALLRLLGGRDGPASRETSGFGSSLEYAGLVYGKAPGLYRALEAKVGRPALDRALGAAIRDRAWKATDPPTWLAALEAGGAAGATELGRHWWDEAHGDADLAIDPEGRAALTMLLGPAVAAQVEQLCKQLGTTPAALIGSMLGGGAAPTAMPPATRSVEELLRQLRR